MQKRCQVWENCDLQLSKVIKRLLNFIDKIYKKDNKLLELVKIDIAYNVEKKIFQDVVHELNNQKHNNHMRKGISLKENFEISFLEQEIYGKSIIKGVVYNEPNFFDEQNLNDAINKKYPGFVKKIFLEKIKYVWLFDTYSVFYENGKLIDLNSQGCENGIRLLNEGKKEHIIELIKKNAEKTNSCY